MMENLYFLFFLIIRVYLCTAQNVEITTQDTRTSRVWRIDELESIDQSLIPKYAEYNDEVPPSDLTESEASCYKNNNNCSKGNNATYGPLCTHLTDYGLVSFPTVCEIEFKNCLIKVQNEIPETKIKREMFYYNQIGKSCDYYVEQTKTIDYAIKMYLLHGKMRRYHEQIIASAKKNNA